MSAISSVGASSSVYSQLASGYRINSAADDAAGLGIAEREDAQIKGMDQGTNNMESLKDVTRVADGALSGITDSLQRMRELAVQASNGLLTSSDRGAIQEEINQLKQGISDIAGQTTYNTKNILDGSNPAFSAATDGNGNSMGIDNGNATLQSLGIASFDVTGDFDISDIDKALDKVNSMRAVTGAQSNALDYQIDVSKYSSYNTTAAKSRIEDLDYPQAVSEQKKQQLLETYTLMMQKKKQEQEEHQSQALFSPTFLR